MGHCNPDGFIRQPETHRSYGWCMQPISQVGKCSSQEPDFVNVNIIIIDWLIYFVGTEWLQSASVFATISDPDVPTLSTKNVQQTSITLTWNFAGTQIKNSSVLYYVDLSSMSSWQTTNSINSLSGLTPGHTYVLYLRVQSFSKTARSANQTITTRKCVRDPLHFLPRDAMLARY